MSSIHPLHTVFGMTRLWIEPQFPVLMVSTLKITQLVSSLVVPKLI